MTPIVGYLARLGIGKGVIKTGKFLARKIFGLGKKVPKKRGIVGSLVKTAFTAPLYTGAAIAVTYGSARYALNNASNYLTRRQIETLKDESVDYRRRLEVLERYKIGVERDLRKDGDKINYLEREIGNVNQQIKVLGKLERSTTGHDQKYETQRTLLAFGIGGLIVSMGISSSIITGNVISGINNQAFPIVTATFIISLLLVFSGLKSRGTKGK